MEEADLRLVDHEVGDEPSRCLAQEEFRRAVAELEIRRIRRHVFDEMMVEERHAYLERVRHGGAVEVVQHVVEAERAARRRASAADKRIARAAAREVPERRQAQPTRRAPGAAKRAPSSAPIRQISLEPRGTRSPPSSRGRRLGEAACPRRPMTGGAAERSSDHRRARGSIAARVARGDGGGSRRRARRRPGRRAQRSRPRARPLSARKPSAREIGERLVDVPDELLEVDGVVRSRRARARGGRCRTCAATQRAIGELACRRPRRNRPRTSSPAAADVRGHERDDQARVEAAAQHRPERHVAHQPQPHRLRRGPR